MDDDLNPAFVVAVASTTVAAHDAGRRCQSCTDHGCEQDAWARQTIAEHRAKRARTDHRPHPLAGLARRTA